MIKTSIIPTLCLLFISLASANAQAGHRQPIKKPGTYAQQKAGNIQHIRAILLQQEQTRQAKLKSAARETSVLAERLVAFGGYSFNYADTPMYPAGKVDSGLFKYSGQRGSVFNFNSMSFDGPEWYYFNAGYPAVYLVSGSANNSSGVNYNPGLLCDSSYMWNTNYTDLVGNHIFQLEQETDIIYNAGNKISFLHDSIYPSSYSEGDYYFVSPNSNNRIDSGLWIFSFLGSTDTNSYSIHEYNASGLPSSDSIRVYVSPGTYMLNGFWTYSYDASGNLTYAVFYTDSLGYWVPHEKLFATYNTDNSLQKDSLISFTSTTWMPAETDSFGYTAGAAYCTYMRGRIFYGDSLSESIVTKHIAVSGLPDTVYAAQYNEFGFGPYLNLNLERQTKYWCTYDSYGNPNIFYNYDYVITDSSTGAGYYNTALAGITYFYYETYMSSLVNNLSAATENIIIYPNPSTNVITISRPEANKGAYTLITLTNAMGQTVRTEGLPWMNVTETFSLAGLVPGIYMLTVKDNNGNALTTQKIIRQ